MASLNLPMADLYDAQQWWEADQERRETMPQTITIYRSEGNAYQEPTYRLAPPHPAEDARPYTALQADLYDLELLQSPEHGGPILCTPDRTGVYSILNAMALGKLVVRADEA